MQTPNSFTVTVTERHWERARERYRQSNMTIIFDCPVALAVEEVLGPWNRDTHNYAGNGIAVEYSQVNGVKYTTPEPVRPIIRAFDKDHYQDFPGPAIGTFYRMRE